MLRELRTPCMMLRGWGDVGDMDGVMGGPLTCGGSISSFPTIGAPHLSSSSLLRFISCNSITCASARRRRVASVLHSSRLECSSRRSSSAIWSASVARRRAASASSSNSLTRRFARLNSFSTSMDTPLRLSRFSISLSNSTIRLWSASCSLVAPSMAVLVLLTNFRSFLVSASNSATLLLDSRPLRPPRVNRSISAFATSN
mmetsp:Transcript_53423/g.115997  ORF Transcript_53423/g.115997 Transcript_53423/m.115997 type:complete len:201 (+) Transcript_53423:93-695(+)